MIRSRNGIVMLGFLCASAAGCSSGDPSRATPDAGASRSRLEAAAAPEAISLFGRPLFAPVLPPADRAGREASLAEAVARHAAAPDDAAAIIWLGRRLAYLGRIREAIDVYTDGISRHPDDPRLYRHRGHRYITARRFPEATTDLERAARLIAGRPDEIEPDGMPNAKNVPVSTLQFNVWYHLGLVRFLAGDADGAVRAWTECLKVSTNPDMLCSTSNWLYLALRRLDRRDEADKVLVPIRADLEVIEDQDYLRLLRVYRGEADAGRTLAEATASGSILSLPTVGNGLATWHLLEGRRERAVELYDKVLAEGQWMTFGAIAAEAELRRLGVSPHE
jgi:tetratricopeptide (TPR) repeat protein